MVAFGFRLHWLEHLALFLLARLDPMVNPAGYASSLIVVENNAASNRRRHLRNAPPYPWAPGATATDSNHPWISCGRYVRQPKDKSVADALGLDSASQSCPRLQQPFANCQTAKLQRNQNGLSTLLFEIEPLELSGWGLELCRTHVWRHHWNEARNMYVLNHTSKQYSANTRCEYTAIYIHTYVHTARALVQSCHCEFCCGMHLACKNNPVALDRNGSVKRPVKVSEGYHRHSQCSGNHFFWKDGWNKSQIAATYVSYMK